MINSIQNIQIVPILEVVVLVLIGSYLIFSFLVIRQIGVLVNDVKTNLSKLIYGLGIINLILAVLAFIASLALLL